MLFKYQESSILGQIKFDQFYAEAGSRTGAYSRTRINSKFGGKGLGVGTLNSDTSNLQSLTPKLWELGFNPCPEISPQDTCKIDWIQINDSYTANITTAGLTLFDVTHLRSLLRSWFGLKCWNLPLAAHSSSNKEERSTAPRALSIRSTLAMSLGVTF